MSPSSLLRLLAAGLPLTLAAQPIAAAAGSAPPLYNYQPGRVFLVDFSIPLPTGPGWKTLSKAKWFREEQPLKLEFSLVCINFRSQQTPSFKNVDDLLGGEGWPGITENFQIGFERRQNQEEKDKPIIAGDARRPARLRAGGVKTSSGTIGISSLTRPGEYDWYLPMQTNELSVIQYAAVMHPDAPPPSVHKNDLLQPQTRLSRRETEEFTNKLNELNLFRVKEQENSSQLLPWNIRQASAHNRKDGTTRIEFGENVLGRHFTFGLPTQTEWEYAARGGDNNIGHYGDDYPLSTLKGSGSARRYEYCGEDPEASVKKHVVSINTVRQRNCLGLLNMLGNAREWVDDDRIPHGAGMEGNPLKRSPEGAVSPASRGEDMGTTQGAPGIGFRLVIRSQIYSPFSGNPYGIKRRRNYGDDLVTELAADEAASVPKPNSTPDAIGREEAPQQKKKEPPPAPPKLSLEEELRLHEQCIFGTYGESCRDADKLGHAEAQFRAGIIHDHGTGIEKPTPPKAFSWHMKTAGGIKWYKEAVLSQPGLA